MSQTDQIVPQLMPSTLQHLNLKSSNVAETWRMWKTQFKMYMRASNLESQEDKRRVAILLHHMGPESLQIFSSFNVNEDVVKYDDLVKKFDDYFLPRINIAVERHKFFTRKQKQHESIEEYITVLKNLSLNCNFKDLREELVKDIFICGLTAQRSYIKERLLSEGDIKLFRAIEIAKNMETVKEDASLLQSENGDEAAFSVAALNKMNKNNNFKNYSNSNTNYKSNDNSNNNRNNNNYNNPQRVCNKCGSVHKERCPAMGVVCHYCQRLNHFAKMCFAKRKANENNKYVKVLEEGEDEHVFVGVIKTIGNKISAVNLKKTQETTAARQLEKIGEKQNWFVDVEASKKSLKCQVDTGAQTNILSVNTIRYLKMNKLIEYSDKKILTFSGEELPLLGKINLNFNFKCNEYCADFHVLNMDCNNIIGLKTAEAMNLIHTINVIGANKIFEEYKDVFLGLGLLKNVCDFKLKADAIPVVDPPRRIPYCLHNELKMELDRLVESNVIAPISEPTEWVSSIVLVKKPNGRLRLCLDPRNLNEAILRPHFPFPNIEDCKAKLHGSKYFSTLDANSGFWMVPLSERSSRLCTFNTPFGRFKFLRLPFGINAAPEMFHGEMLRLFGDIQGLIIYIDDFLIHASSEEEHNKILSEVLVRARNVGVKFNRTKSKIGLSEVKFIGHVFNEQGVKADIEKIEAIMKMSAPKSVPELQRFLGMVNYLGPFIENLADKNKHLRVLLKKNVLWHWEEAQEKEFQDLKREITQAPVLSYFDKSKDLVLSVDASKFALGAAILNEGRPIAYASASLTDSQMNYAQIEKELFAILFGCVKFHQYIYGARVIVETDHKPLVSLFKKPLFKIPARLQRFMLRLQAYNIDVNYKPGKYLFIADTLSRSPLPEKLTKMDDDVELHCDMIMTQIVESNSNHNLEEIRDAQGSDVVMAKIKEYILQGWPRVKELVLEGTMPYYKIKDDLNIINGILLKNNQIIIPKELRRKILGKIHEGHFGINRCQSIARCTVYWPGMNNDIFNLVSSCEVCLKHSNANPKMELMSHEIVNIPWYKVGSDIFEFKKRQYLLVVDYFSKFIEVELLSNGYSSSQVITRLKSIFSRHGIPHVLVSDNGPPYNSREFKDFCQEWGIDHTTSSPYMPRSNGLAERSVQTVKKMLVKCEEDKSDPYIALLHYRTSPKEGLPSPSELLMSRQLRTKIPSIQSYFEPKLINVENYRANVENRRKKSSGYYNRKTRNLKPLSVGDNVMFRKTPTSCWNTGTVIQNCIQPRSYIINDSKGATYRRNREHLKRIGEDNMREKSTNRPKVHSTFYPENGFGVGSTNTLDDAEVSNEDEVSTVHQNDNVLAEQENRIDTSDNVPTTSEREGVYVTGSGREVRPPIRFTFD